MARSAHKTKHAVIVLGAFSCSVGAPVSRGVLPTSCVCGYGGVATYGWKNSAMRGLDVVLRKSYMLSCRTKLEKLLCLKCFGITCGGDYAITMVMVMMMSRILRHIA